MHNIMPFKANRKNSRRKRTQRRARRRQVKISSIRQMTISVMRRRDLERQKNPVTLPRLRLLAL